MLKPFGKSLSQHMQGVELAVPSGLNTESMQDLSHL